MKKFLVLLVVIAMFTVVSQGIAAQRYTITNTTPASSGNDSSAGAINNSGQITGMIHLYSYNRAGYLWEDGVVTNLGYLSSIKSTHGDDINEAGQIVGLSAVGATSHWSGIYHAFLWENGVIRDLGTLSGFNRSRAWGVNNSAQVVGYLDNHDNNAKRAFLWQNGVMIDLGTLGGQRSEAFDINDKGQIVGWADTADGGRKGFLWENGVMQPLEMSAAMAINNLGQIAGTITTADGVPHLALWENGVVTDLGTLPGIVSKMRVDGMNNMGQIVGNAYVNSEYRPYIWENGVIKELNDLMIVSQNAWVLTWVTGINDKGQIVGDGYVNGGQWRHGFVLTPIATKAIDAVDRFGDTAMIDVFSGDSFTYTIEVPNVFDQLVYFRVQDTLDTYLTYDPNTLTVNGTGVSNSYFTSGVLDYEDPTQIIGIDEILSLSFAVSVNDLAAGEAHGWMINNVATITAYTSSGAVLETMDTNLVQARIENPSGDPVPEPGTILLLGVGVIGLVGLRRTMRKK